MKHNSVSRKNGLDIYKWVQASLKKVQKEEIDEFERFEKVQTVLAASLSEIIRQLKSSVKEQGKVMEVI